MTRLSIEKKKYYVSGAPVVRRLPTIPLPHIPYSVQFPKIAKFTIFFSIHEPFIENFRKMYVPYSLINLQVFQNFRIPSGFRGSSGYRNSNLWVRIPPRFRPKFGKKPKIYFWKCCREIASKISPLKLYFSRRSAEKPKSSKLHLKFRSTFSPHLKSNNRKRQKINFFVL